MSQCLDQKPTKAFFFCFRGNDIMTLKQKVTVVKVVFSDDYTQTHTHRRITATCKGPLIIFTQCEDATTF